MILITIVYTLDIIVTNYFNLGLVYFLLTQLLSIHMIGNYISQQVWVENTKSTLWHCFVLDQQYHHNHLLHQQPWQEPNHHHCYDATVDNHVNSAQWQCNSSSNTNSSGRQRSSTTPAAAAAQWQQQHHQQCDGGSITITTGSSSGNVTSASPLVVVGTQQRHHHQQQGRTNGNGRMGKQQQGSTAAAYSVYSRNLYSLL